MKVTSMFAKPSSSPAKDEAVLLSAVKWAERVEVDAEDAGVVEVVDRYGIIPSVDRALNCLMIEESSDKHCRPLA